jgi:hypothetical protein
MTREKRAWEKRGKNGGGRWDYSTVEVHCFEDTVSVVMQ